MTQQALGGQSELRQIAAALRAWDARTRLGESVRWLPRGLAAGLALAALLALAARLWPLLPRPDVIRLAVLLAIAGAAVALLVVWLRQRAPLDLARRYDRQLGLRERLSTALELSGGLIPAESPALAAAQRADAAHALAQVDARRRLPIRHDWRSWALAALALGAFLAAILIPNSQEEVLSGQAAVEEAVAEQIEALEALRAQALEDPTLSEEQREAVVEALDGAIETLSQRGVSREEALAALGAATQELRDLSEQAAAERQQALQEAGEAFEQAGAEQVAEALQQGDLAGAGQALSDLAQRVEGMSAEEAQALAEQLEAAADALEESDPALAEALREAAEALRSGDPQAAAEALEQAGQQMAEAGEGEPSVQEYAESLEQGQAEFAESSKTGPPREGQAPQPGQQGMGEAQPAQPGQPGQPGEGPSGSGSEQADGPDAGQVAGETPRQSDAPADGGERPPEIYAPQRVGGEGGEQVEVPGQPGQGAPAQEGQFAENPTGEASVPYSEVFPDYSEAVNQALESGYIPLGMRSLIQQYFSRLDPAQ